jgi:hypothetical protein
MKIRTATEADVEALAEWAFSTPENGLDPAIASYPHLTVFVVEDENGPLLYTPTHPVLAIESNAVRPGITPRQYMTALLAMKDQTESFARQYNMRGIVTSSAFPPMTKTLRRHGYVTPPGTAFWKRV